MPEIADCPHCHIRMLPSDDGTCPSCGNSIHEQPDPGSPPIEPPGVAPGHSFENPRIPFWLAPFIVPILAVLGTLRLLRRHGPEEFSPWIVVFVAVTGVIAGLIVYVWDRRRQRWYEDFDIDRRKAG